MSASQSIQHFFNEFLIAKADHSECERALRSAETRRRNAENELVKAVGPDRSVYVFCEVVGPGGRRRQHLAIRAKAHSQTACDFRIEEIPLEDGDQPWT